MNENLKTRLQVFSIRDKVADAFMPPFFMPTVGMAIRAFGDDCKNPNGNLAKHLSDFELYHLGGFDDGNAQFHILPQSEYRVISRGSDFLQPPAA